MEVFDFMNLNSITLLILVVVVVAALTLLYGSHHHKSGSAKLPPGTMGWPLVGETWQFLSCGWKGKPEKFVTERLPKDKHVPQMAFKTSLFGEKFIIMGGAMANKFIFSNENKLVQVWWPKSVQKIITSDFTDKDLVKRVRKILHPFFMPEALQRYIPIMDKIAKQHFATEWKGKDKVKVLPLAKRYTFWLASHIFLSIEDSNKVAEFFGPFNDITAGVISIPINLPGTTYNQGVKASKLIKKKIIDIMKQRKVDLANGKASPTQDILSQMMFSSDENGRYLSESEIVNNLLGLLVAGHDTSSAVCALIVKYLADFTHVYDSVYKEQMEIASSKTDGELLNWEDIQKMKYSWNVVCEVLRINPSIPGLFREAIEDFTFDGFKIPKGWKVLSSVYTTQANHECFPEPEKFDPSRFEGTVPPPYTFVPFGGGPRMCMGKEYARLDILVFMHNLVKSFKWDTIIPDEKIIMNPFPMPAKALPICLYPNPHASLQ